jgi:signal transduction histidine kinase
MNSSSLTQPVMSEQALPAEVSIQSDTWLNRYRNFPVFSKTWFRHRSIAFIGTYLFITTIVFIIALITKGDWRLYSVVVLPTLLSAVSLTVAGQAMAVWVRQKRFAPKKEAICLCLALVMGAAFTFGVFKASGRLAKLAIYGDASHKIFDDKKREPAKKPADVPSASAASVSASGSISEPASTSAPASASATAAKPKTDDTDIEIDKWVQMVVGASPMAFLLFYTGSGFDLWFFFRQRKRLAEALRQQELKRAQDARREAELRLSVLVAQVEPHFLFNTLAGVRSAILTEPLRATAIVDHLVDYLRSTIPQMRGDGSTEQGRLAKQLEATRAYLGLMQARIPRLTYSVESELKDAAFPPLLLISLVENAIKHGVEPKIGPVHVSVSARYFDQDNEEKLEVAVSDNGLGFGGTTSGSGIGLANIRERLESMYGTRASLVLKARPEGGVTASIVIPLIA